MNNLAKLTYYLNYSLLIASPRSIDLTTIQNAKKGELSDLPLFVVIAVEFMIRVAFILLLATAVEILLGEPLYEQYNLDLAFQVLVLTGGIHSLCYCLVLGYWRQRIGLANAMRWYRLMRNLCYAALPGLLVIALVITWAELSTPPYNSDSMLLEIYLFTTAAMTICGLVEALLVRRKPLGLDHNLDSDNQ